MAKYFTIERVQQAAQHLSQFDSKWLLPPFVFASNGVTQGAFILRKFFSGSLIGLPKKGNGDSLRPKFREIGGPLPQGALPADTDVVLHQKQVLWGSLYSRNGYREMLEGGQLLGDGPSRFKLTATFQPTFEAKILPEFNFEELLVWLFAFRDIPDGCNSWQELWDYFRTTYLSGDDIPAEYKGRFRIRTGATVVPWPAAFLNQRPTNVEYQKALLPSEFTEALTLAVWQDILTRLVELAKPKYLGIAAAEISQICEAAISGLVATKRVFLLGDPGVGKSEFAKLIADAFDSVVGQDRLLSIPVEITEKSTETSLVGFTGIDGRWIDGALTSPHEGKRLMYPVGPQQTSNVRGQVNLLILNEANRQDAEALLAKIQNALDCVSKDPADPSFKIPLGASGDHRISPYTYIVMTGNSPRDDEGRVAQSRPFRRRVSLVSLPNPLTEIVTSNTTPFSQILQELWQDAASDSMLSAVDSTNFHAELAEPINTPCLDCLKRVLIVMAEHAGGLSYGLLKKLLILSGNRRALRGGTVAEALDASAVVGLTPLLIAASAKAGKSLGERLKNENLGALPRLKDWCENQLGAADEFGSVPPGL
jgi:hypothetical protein